MVDDPLTPLPMRIAIFKMGTGWVAAHLEYNVVFCGDSRLRVITDLLAYFTKVSEKTLETVGRANPNGQIFTFWSQQSPQILAFKTGYRNKKAEYLERCLAGLKGNGRTQEAFEVSFGSSGMDRTNIPIDASDTFFDQLMEDES